MAGLNCTHILQHLFYSLKISENSQTKLHFGTDTTWNDQLCQISDMLVYKCWFSHSHTLTLRLMVLCSNFPFLVIRSVGQQSLSCILFYHGHICLHLILFFTCCDLEEFIELLCIRLECPVHTFRISVGYCLCNKMIKPPSGSGYNFILSGLTTSGCVYVQHVLMTSIYWSHLRSSHAAKNISYPLHCTSSQNI